MNIEIILFYLITPIFYGININDHYDYLFTIIIFVFNRETTKLAAGELMLKKLSVNKKLTAWVVEWQ